MGMQTGATTKATASHGGLIGWTLDDLPSKSINWQNGVREGHKESEDLGHK